MPALGGFLVVTASEDESNAFHGNTLWFVADGETSRAHKIATFEVAMKAEGLAILGVEKDAERTVVKLLITYDNDPHATKIPSRFQTVTLVREGRQRRFAEDLVVGVFAEGRPIKEQSRFALSASRFPGGQRRPYFFNTEIRRVSQRPEPGPEPGGGHFRRRTKLCERASPVLEVPPAQIRASSRRNRNLS